ncbi:MAG: hypothetical protein K2G70_02555 [Turicibacter sp.]|nr:hypothetical protein [Turicibacter sp.]
MTDLQLNGFGKSKGGTFKGVQLNGIHYCFDLITCETFQAQGIFKVDEVICQKVMEFEGIARVKQLKTSHFEGVGVCQVKQNLQCDSLEFGGYLKVGESLKVGQAVIRGKFKFGEQVEAKVLTGMFEGKSSFEVMSADVICLKREEEGFYTENRSWPLRFKNVRVSGQLIEGEQIDIEYCHVKQVYGDYVKIGPYCQIDEVEYKESLEIHPTAVVKRLKRL